MKAKNPYLGMHPDLFPREHQYPGPEEAIEGIKRAGIAPDVGGAAWATTPAEAKRRLAAWKRGETPMFVPVDQLSSDQIRELPRLAFTNEEWENLDDDDREWIEENDGDSQERVDDLAKIFIDRYKWEAEGTDRDYSTIEAGIEYYLSEHADEMWKEVPNDTYDELVAYADGLGVPETDVQRVLNELLVDTNNYDFSTDTYVPRGTVYSEEVRGSVYVERSDWISEFEACTPDEVERALKKIHKDTDNVIDIDANDLASTRKYATIEHDFDTGMYMSASIKNWESIADRARQAIDEIEIPDDRDMPGALAPEERVVFRWPDGFYVQDLIPSELLAEGKIMGMCVGRPDMGYGKAVRDGEIKILSVRRPSGKPLFTIEASLNRRSMLGERKTWQITSIDQVKGKANRKPGFDLGKDRGVFSVAYRGGSGELVGGEAAKVEAIAAMKRDEVQRVIEYVLSIGIDPATVEDLEPALAAISALRQAGDKWATELATKIPGFEPVTEEPPKQNPTECPMGHGAGCTGFCLPYRRRRRP